MDHEHRRKPRINTTDVLAGIADTDLRSFLRKELRSNKQLSIKLKATFIDSIILPNDENKYEALLEEMLFIGTTGRINLTKRKIALLNFVLEQFLNLSNALIRSGAHRENYNLLVAVVSGLHMYVDKIQAPANKLVDSLVKAYENLQILCQHAIAPELRDAIFEQGMQLLRRPSYRLYSKSQNILPILIQTSTTEDQRRDIVRAIENKLDSGLQDVDWLTAYLEIGLDSGVFKDHLLKQLPASTSYQVAQRVQAHKNDKALAWLADDLYSNNRLSEHQRESLARWRIDSALRQRDQDPVIEYLVELAVLHGDLSAIFDLLESQDTMDIPYESLVKGLLDRGEHTLAARLLAHHQDNVNLIQLIRDMQSLELFNEHLERIWSLSQYDVHTIAREVLLHYVNHHAGRECVENVEQFLGKLRDIGGIEEARTLHEQIHSEFPDRFQTPVTQLGIS